MAYEFYVTVKFDKQGDNKGESIKEAHKKKIPGLSYHHSIQAPRDVATGRPSGARQHGPITFTKEWGPSSPLFASALCQNENLSSVLFEFMQTNKMGESEIYHTIKLTNATVSKIEYRTGGGMTGGQSSAKTEAAYDTMELEEISMTYQKIEVENLPGKTMFTDDWATTQ